MNRVLLILAVGLGVSVVGARDLKAQRSGFIIGFGIGAGVTWFSVPGSGSDGEAGLATDFKIGAQVSQSVQVYYLGRTNWFKPRAFEAKTSNRTLSLRRRGSFVVAAGISAIGVTYVLPSAPVHLSGGVGLATWIDFGGGAVSFSGPGLTGGVGWEFADLWLLDFALTYGNLRDVFPGEPVNMDVFLARIGISILSH